jgi:hypothetical protein
MLTEAEMTPQQDDPDGWIERFLAKAGHHMALLRR